MHPLGARIVESDDAGAWSPTAHRPATPLFNVASRPVVPVMGSRVPHFPFMQAPSAPAFLTPTQPQRRSYFHTVKSPFRGNLFGDAGAVMEIDAGQLVEIDASTVPGIDAGWLMSPDAGFLVNADSGEVVELDAGAVFGLDAGALVGMDAAGDDFATELDAAGNEDDDIDAGAFDDLLEGGVLSEMEAAGFFDDVSNFIKKKVAPAAKMIEKAASPYLDMAQTALSSVPGFGTVASAALGGIRGAAAGKSLKEIGMQAVGGALPGGPATKALLSAGLGAIENVAKGQGWKGALKGAGQGALGEVSKLIPGQYGQLANQIGGSLLNAIPTGGQGKTPKPTAATVEQKVLTNPALRALPTAQLAQVLRVPPTTAAAGQKRVMGRLGAFMPRGASVDQALIQAGQPAPAVSSPIVGPLRSAPFTARGIGAAMQLVPALRFAPPDFLASLTSQGAQTIAMRDASGIDGTNPKVYIVEPGDTYVKIAAKLGHPGEVPPLIKANPQIANPSAIFPGQKLNIPPAWLITSVPTSPYSIPGTMPAPQLPTQPSTGPVPTSLGRGTVVQPGDTMAKIAADFGHPGEVGTLIKANPQISDPSKIYPGQVLNLPPGWGGKGEEPRDPPFNQPNPAPAPSMPAPSMPAPPGYQPSPPPAMPAPPSGGYGPTVTDPNIARVQTNLSVWATRTGACNPKDFGSSAAIPPWAEFTGTWTERTRSALGSFQLWANATRGAKLRTDAMLDPETDGLLQKVVGELLANAPAPAPAPGTPGQMPGQPTFPGLPGLPGQPSQPQPQPQPQPAQGGSGLLPLAALAALMFLK